MEVKWNNHIVILYDKTKDAQAAEALEFYIESEFNPCDAILVDRTEYTGMVARVVADKSRSFAVRHARGLLRLISEKRKAKALSDIKEQNRNRNQQPENPEKEGGDAALRRVLNVFKRFEPVMVICTTPHSLELALKAKALYGRDVYVVGAVTDFALDPAFVHLDADGYFVENPEIKQTLVQHGVDVARISVIGMPSLKIDNGMTVDKKKQALGILDDLPVVVVYGGEYGTGTIKEDVEMLMRKKERFNLVIITANKALRHAYMELPEFSAGVLIREQLDENLLDVADILVTVPESRPVFAAFMRGVSVVVTQSVTEHEHEIRRYLVKRALAIPSRTPMETLFAIDELLEDEARRKEFRDRGETYASMSLADIRNMAPQLPAGIKLKIEGGSSGDRPEGV